MENLKKILFILILLFPCTLLFSACDTSSEQKIQKKQNIIITKKITPPKQQTKIGQSNANQATKKPAVENEPVVVIDKKDRKTIANTDNAQNDKNIPKKASTNNKINKAKDISSKTKTSTLPKATIVAVDTSTSSHTQPKTVIATSIAKNNVADTNSAPINITNDTKKENNILNNISADKNTSENLSAEIHDMDNIPYYVSKGKIDPFLSPIKKIIVKRRKQKQNRKKLTPLEKLDLSQLKLVAIVRMQTKKKTFAMVQESDGKGYMVKIGTYIGTNNGRIVAIKDNGIDIKEEIENFDGTTKYKITKMKLQKKDNG